MVTGGAIGARCSHQPESTPQPSRCVVPNRPRPFFDDIVRHAFKPLTDNLCLQLYTTTLGTYTSHPQLVAILKCFCECVRCIRWGAMLRGEGVCLWPGRLQGRGSFHAWSCLSNWDQVSLSHFLTHRFIILLSKDINLLTKLYIF